MAEFVRAYAGDKTNTLVTVSKAFAENVGLHTVKDAATDVHGRPLPPAEGYRRSKSSASRPDAVEQDTTTSGGGNAASNSEEAL